MQYGNYCITALVSANKEVAWGSIRQRQGAMKITQDVVGQREEFMHRLSLSLMQGVILTAFMTCPEKQPAVF